MPDIPIAGNGDDGYDPRMEERVSTRIGSVEKALAHQAESIGTLHVHLQRTDASLQRLISRVDQLFEVAVAASQSAAFVPVITPALVAPE